MNKRITKLVKAARKVRMTEQEQYEQRVSFAYGSAKIENENVTRKMVVEAAHNSPKSTIGKAG